MCVSESVSLSMSLFMYMSTGCRHSHPMYLAVRPFMSHLQPPINCIFSMSVSRSVPAVSVTVSVQVIHLCIHLLSMPYIFTGDAVQGEANGATHKSCGTSIKDAIVDVNQIGRFTVDLCIMPISGNDRKEPLTYGKGNTASH